MRSSMTPPASFSMQLYSALPDTVSLATSLARSLREELAHARAARVDHTHV